MKCVFTIQAINAIKSNVWMVFLILIGTFLIVRGHDVAGTSLITGSFAIIRSSTEHGEADGAGNSKPS